eukprot:Plantae.Rhodophyta-Hildenbrandia_rubra.ctg10728.p1 GENE.Plantae.Rhodophyta-Hildenbrandia_rubra.ctg10728~~Plantae.Rhodophyta-Hildenbrandia_rubra.ctg10728.p1  ORF type:complete len:802 (-),score=101.69 Plantae.Rhodophyta-Hildenbrandia_rubra.ctg10728:2440-4845(-)
MAAGVASFASVDSSNLLIRALVSCLLKEDQCLPSSLVLQSLRSQFPCSLLSQNRAEQLLGAIADSLDCEATRNFALDVTLEVFKQAPPKVLEPFVPAIGQRVLSQVKKEYVSEGGCNVRKALLVLSGILVTGRGINWGEGSKGSLLEASLTQAANCLNGSVALKEGVILLRTCIAVHPVAVRRINGKLKDVLWNLLHVKGVPEVILGVLRSNNARVQTHEVIKLYERTASEIQDLVCLVLMFGRRGSSPISRRKEDSRLKSNWTDHVDSEQIVIRYGALCRALGLLIAGDILPVSTPLSIWTVLKNVCMVLNMRVVQKFARTDHPVRVEHKSMAIILPVLHSLSIECLQKAVKLLGRRTLLPVAKMMCRTLVSSLVTDYKMDINTQKSRESRARLSLSRLEAYRAAEVFIYEFGSIAVNIFGKPLCKAVVNDLELLVDETLMSSKHIFDKQKARQQSENTWRGKRRRVVGPTERNVSSDWQGESEVMRNEQYAEFCNGNQWFCALRKVCHNGVAALTMLLCSRAIFTPECAVYIHELEQKLINLVAKGPMGDDLICAILSALGPAVVGGGSGRMTALSSPFLGEAIKIFQSVSSGSITTFKASRAAVFALAGCDALVHPRGCPVMVKKKADGPRLRPKETIKFTDVHLNHKSHNGDKERPENAGSSGQKSVICNGETAAIATRGFAGTVHTSENKVAEQWERLRQSSNRDAHVPRALPDQKRNAANSSSKAPSNALLSQQNEERLRKTGSASGKECDMQDRARRTLHIAETDTPSSLHPRKGVPRLNSIDDEGHKAEVGKH